MHRCAPLTDFAPAFRRSFVRVTVCFLGDRYEGEYNENRITGIGVFYYSTGDRYEGQLVDGRAKGKGTWYYTDGSRHVGKWRDHQPHGEGTRYQTDKSYYIGVWENGALVQKVKEVGTNGATIATSTAPIPPTPLVPPSLPTHLTINPTLGSPSSSSSSGLGLGSGPHILKSATGSTPRMGLGLGLGVNGGEHAMIASPSTHPLPSPSQRKT